MAQNLSEEEKDLLEKIAEVKKKKGGVDPTIVVYRDESQPIRIVVRAIKPPIIVGDYVSISVSDPDFLRIVQVFQQIQKSGVSMSRSFEPREGGRSYSKMEYYNSLEVVERFIEDVYGVEKFFRRPLDSRFVTLTPLKNLHELVSEKWQQDPSILERGPHTSVFPLIDNMKWFSTEEFEQHMLPFLEAAFLWEENKKLGLTTFEFRGVVSQRIRRGDQSALYGYLSEVYTSGLYIFSGWKDLSYIDKRGTSQSHKHGDWVYESTVLGKLGIECKDKRQTVQGQNQVRLGDVQDLVDKAIEKLSGDRDLQKRMLWINLTNIKDYSRPLLTELGDIQSCEPRDIVAGILKPSFSLCNRHGNIDCVVFAWREKMEGDSGFDYVQRYVITEGVDYNAYLPQVQPLIHLAPGKHFLVRKFVFPEPTFGEWGPVETAE